MPASTHAIAATIDHTWLPEWPLQDMSDDDVATKPTQLCTEAKTHGFAAVCVRPAHVAACVALLGGSTVQVATVIGFPQHKVTLGDEQQAPTIGSVYLEDKLAEIKHAIADGATELDVVWDVGAFLTGADLGRVEGTLAELKAYKAAAGDTPIKLIVEIDLLPELYHPLAAELCAKVGLAMIKTSTGYVQGGTGATVAAIAAFKQGLGDKYPAVGIKASGGVKTPAQAKAMVAAGANRIGTSNGVALL